MTTKRFISVLAIMIVAMFTTTSLFGQTRVALKGSAYMVSDNSGNKYGLEVNGKLVVPKEYANFSTPDGKTFAVETLGGKFKVCADDGEFLFKGEFFKVSINGGIVGTWETENSTPKFYDAETLVEKEVTQVSGNYFAEQAEANGAYNPTLRAQRAAVEKAAELSAQAPSYAKFEIRTNERGKQDLIVDNKIIVSGKTFVVLSDMKQWGEAPAWFFIVEDVVDGYKSHGVYVLCPYMKDGKKYLDHQYTIPLEYSHIRPDGGSFMLECTTRSGAIKRLSFMGKAPGN